MKYLLHRMAVVHRKLDSEITHETKRRWPDALRIARLKKLRLALKDRLAGHIGKPAFSIRS